MKFSVRLKKLSTGDWEYMLQTDEQLLKTVDSGIVKTKKQALEEAKHSKKMYLESQKTKEIEMIEDF